MSTREGSIFIECRYGVWVLTMHGEHDVSTEPSLAEELERVTAAGGPVVIDLTDAEFIDSTILRTLVNAAGRSGDEVAVVAPAGREPLRLMRLTGVDSVLRVCETCKAAIAAIGPSDRYSTSNAMRTIKPGLASSSVTPSDAS